MHACRCYGKVKDGDLCAQYDVIPAQIQDSDKRNIFITKTLLFKTEFRIPVMVKCM